jgi:hypothetical protein
MFEFGASYNDRDCRRAIVYGKVLCALKKTVYGEILWPATWLSMPAVRWTGERMDFSWIVIFRCR